METILVVEDDRLVREYVVSQLTALGYPIVSARNAREALDIMQSGIHVDLLFTDIVMPGGMDGMQLATAARRMRPSLAVLFTSGYSENLLADEYARGEFCLLKKPYRRNVLAERLRHVLSGRRNAA